MIRNTSIALPDVSSDLQPYDILVTTLRQFKSQYAGSLVKEDASD